MKWFMSRWAGPIYAILRIIAGIMFMMHGTQKLLGFPPTEQLPPVGSLGWVAGVIELVTGALIAIGFLTNIAAFIASGLMAAAYFIAHAPNGFFPIVNHGELAVVYCFLWLFVSAFGGGQWSVDSARARSRRG